MGIEKIAGHHVAAEEKVVFGAIKSAVAQRMAGKMDDLQAAPKRQLLSVGNEFIDLGGAVAKNFPAGGFQPAAPAVHALIRIGAVDVSLLIRMRVNFCTGPVFEPGDIPGVVKMTMGQQDGFERLRRQVEATEQAADEERFANEAGIDHCALVAVVQEVAATHEAADMVEIRRSIAHALKVADRKKLAVIQKITGGKKHFDGVGYR